MLRKSERTFRYVRASWQSWRPIPEQATCEFLTSKREALGGLEVAEEYDPNHPMYVALVTVRRNGDWRLNITDHSFEVDD
jgi:hypothetical protein